MASSFNHSKLKKRITMMLKEKSNPWARLKYLCIFPLTAIAVTAFARPEVSETVEEISVVKVNDLTAIVEAKAVEIANKLVVTDVGDSLLSTSKPQRKPTLIYFTDSLVVSKDSCILPGRSKVIIDPENMKTTVGTNEKVSIHTEADDSHFYLRMTKAKIIPKRNSQPEVKRHDQNEKTVWMKGDAVIDSVRSDKKNEYEFFINDKEAKVNKELKLKGKYGTVALDKKTGKQIVKLYTDEPESIQID